jgi:ElaB/YqjD/DUF883 family membrane-anchored ribosome-binding protein
MAGFGDDETVGRADEPTRGRRVSPTAPVDRTRGWNEERARGSAGVADRGETTERTQQIRAEIEQTREDLSETIGAIQDRLRPGNVASNAAASVRNTASAAVDNVRHAASETLEDFADSRIVQDVRSNPIPATMIGIGLVGVAWLALGGREDRWRGRGRRRTEVFDHGTSAGYYEQRDPYYRGARGSQAASGWATGTRPDQVTADEAGSTTAADLAARTGEFAREAGWKARQTTRRAQNQLQRAVTENPLAVGAAALAVGAMIGMALPETGRENELMGETRDQVVEGAQEMARTAATRVQEVATDAAKRVQDVATDAVGSLGKDRQ